jgi:serine/threonine protein phosphatase PrpC
MIRVNVSPPPAVLPVHATRIDSLTRAQPDRINEDASFHGRLLGESLMVAVVADGSGGSGGGLEASRLAVQSVRRVESTLRPHLMDTGFWTMLFREIDGRVERDRRAGHTTLATVISDGRRAIVTTVGDSLVYHVTAGTVRIVNTGARSTGLIGTDRASLVQRELTVKPGDRLLLATDGFWKYVAHGLLERWLVGLPHEEVLPRILRELMERFSGRIPDDATGVVVSWPSRPADMT